MDNLFAAVAQTPAVQSLARRLEQGGALPCAGVSPAAQPFLAVLLRHLFTRRAVVVVTEGLKTQEIFQQDIETWLKSEIRNPKSEIQNHQPLFYPAWEILPHEAKLPHADVISERLETLVSLAAQSEIGNLRSQIVVTNVAALLQKTFSRDVLKERTRTLTRGDRIDPLDLIEWLEEQGYEPEAQVTQKGEIALRGGILDVYPLSSPWPVRLEFFGDELESLRHFDPHTQMSREEIMSVTLPPGGELGILKREILSSKSQPSTFNPQLSTLLDYLPRETIFVLCEPEQLTLRADEYAQQVPADDPFFISWENILTDLDRRGMTRLELSEIESVAVGLWPAVEPSVSPY
jgi:transcription-repair coupling factor (superfamily II helicase)